VSAVSSARAAAYGGPAVSELHAQRPTRVSGPHAQRSRTPFPTVSVIVPTRNEARNLEIVLPAIAAVMDRAIADGHGREDWTVIAKRALE